MGLIFLLMSAFYAISSPIWGWAADRMVSEKISHLCVHFVGGTTLPQVYEIIFSQNLLAHRFSILV